MKKLLRELLRCADWYLDETLFGGEQEVIAVRWVDVDKAKKLIREYSRKKGKNNVKR